MTNDQGMSIEQLSAMLGELGWGAQNMGSYVTCHPGDTLFHGAFFILDVRGTEWVTGQAFPVVGVPDSLELRKFVNNARLGSGVLLHIQDEGSGLVSVILSAKFPSRNLEADELNFLFYGIFSGGIEVGEEIIGRFGGIWKDES